MYVLGLGGSGHDFSACICNEYGILGYIEDERITRIKHSFYLGNQKKISNMSSVWYLLKFLGLSLSDINKIYANLLLLDIFYKEYIKEESIKKIGHHLAHASSAFYPSEFEESAILVIDGAGGTYDGVNSETLSFWYGKGDEIYNVNTFGGKVLSFDIYRDYSMPFTNSLGGLYRVVTNLLGFGLFDEGKTMGLASYGTEKFWPFFKELFDISSEGAFLMGSDSLKKIIEKSLDLHSFQDKADFAYAAQKVTNLSVIKISQILKNKVGCNNICLAGGVALNSVANYALYKQNIFKNYFIQPSAGDAGTALGSALYGIHHTAME